MKLKIFSCLLAAVLLAGCTAPQGPEPAASPVDTPVPSPESLTVSPWYTTGKGDYVQGGFSVELDEEWQELAVWETYETDTTYGLSFYEPRSRDAGIGGWLFSLVAMPEGLDYTEFPDYELVGWLTTEDGYTENLVAIYPTDVEFTEEAAEVYQALYSRVPDILNSVAATQGYTFQRQ